MEKFQELRELAKKKLQLADHILTMTYPVVKDSRLLLGVVENLFLSLSYAMSSILHYELVFKRIPAFPDDFAAKLELFRDKCMNKYKIDKEHVMLIQDMKEIIVSHKKSPVEFRRKDRLIICDDSYRTRVISVNELKGSIAKAKSFIGNAITIVSRNDSLFN